MEVVQEYFDKKLNGGDLDSRIPLPCSKVGNQQYREGSNDPPSESLDHTT